MVGSVMSALFDLTNIASAVIASTVMPGVGSLLDLGYVPFAILMGIGANAMTMGS
ncbi:hypothetical protein DFR76_11138 [Nocardia pseudobrasiliensis]|uniref:Uncharacterized protein n=1 Tax=Nocardia pseudobrasiliensis TaxID=45979 RepID=A0A370HWZ1_9NOCA|nr:hypothetical protein DFR76_11138 [Nocardia pseudobrasiliensis]